MSIAMLAVILLCVPCALAVPITHWAVKREYERQELKRLKERLALLLTLIK